MLQDAHPIVQTWSTEAVLASQRVEYFENALASALIPFAIRSIADPSAFHASIEVMDLGPLSLQHHRGGLHAAHSGAAEIRRQQAESFHILVNRSAGWRLDHRGAHAFEQDVAAFTDSRYPLVLEALAEYDITNLQLPVAWVREWIPDPQVLVGRPITSRTPWGRALTSFMTAITPRSVSRGALPAHYLADHLGSLLALAAGEFNAKTGVPARPDRGLVGRIEELMRQRCCEPTLTAPEVAASLGISARTLHRHLAANGATFGGILIAARIAVAARMLESKLFKRVTTAEIGRRAGFTDPSHFSRAFACAMGRTPLKFRRELHGTTLDD